MNRKETIWIATLVAAFAVVAVVVARGPVALSHVARIALYLPLTVAALRYGLAGGIAASAGAAATVLANAPRGGWFEATADAVVFGIAGLLLGLFSKREKKQKASYLQVARQLSVAHADLQQNFEGMKRAERLFALGQLSAGLAHEIRNPLASISGAVGILRRSPEHDPRARECLEIIEREAQRLNKLLTNFLDFARPRPPQFRQAKVAELLDSVAALAAHGTGRKQIAIRTECAAGMPDLDTDPEQLQQVLLNLTINAIQASQDGGEVALRAFTPAPGRILIEVTDQGSGIKPEYIDKLFDPFFTTKENGTGLGLPVAHEIVRQFGGVLAARPNEGRGMTFSVSLPLARTGAQ